MCRGRETRPAFSDDSPRVGQTITHPISSFPTSFYARLMPLSSKDLKRLCVSELLHLFFHGWSGVGVSQGNQA